MGGFVALVGVAGTLLLAPSPAHPQVLAAAASLPAGTVLSRADLRTVDAGTAGSGTVGASQEGALLGKTLAFGLPSGALLAPGDVGRFPPAGFMTVSLLVKPGQYPRDLVAGQKVGVLPLTADGSGALSEQQAGAVPAGGGADGSGPGVVPAQLLALTPAGDSQGGMVAELLVAQGQAAQVAAAADTALLGMSGGGL